MESILIGMSIIDIIKAQDGTYGLRLDDGRVLYCEKAENQAIEETFNEVD